MFKSKLNKIFSFSLISTILSIVATLSFVPTLLEEKKGVFTQSNLNYSNTNFIVTVILMAFFTSLAVFFYLKFASAMIKDKEAVKQKSNLYTLIYGGLLTLVSVVVVIYSAFSYKTTTPLDLASNGQIIAKDSLAIAQATNTVIKYSLLSVVFVYFAIVGVLLINKLTIYIISKRKVSA
ncbi:hypothetical protein GE118_01765 [Mycoplasma sp. NEAQ87857]|uniref:hypothetical protein n=1 Tax=Mycoplasma sp. NEAQ87857 TaxID=2683967 RepID=UPI0013177435|nr:hypothetical protein [Mycoplasma sp. NEAQ87857]QGZ97522.1 hypothetical protein GE118_01765 [Mycoplasma sp. NEAQ87857]